MYIYIYTTIRELITRASGSPALKNRLNFIILRRLFYIFPVAVAPGSARKLHVYNTGGIVVLRGLRRIHRYDF